MTTEESSLTKQEKLRRLVIEANMKFGRGTRLRSKIVPYNDNLYLITAQINHFEFVQIGVGYDCIKDEYFWTTSIDLEKRMRDMGEIVGKTVTKNGEDTAC